MSYSRRQFLRTGLAGLGGAWAATWCRALRATGDDTTVPANPQPAPEEKPEKKARVFEISEPKLLDDFGNVNQIDYLPGVLNRLLRDVAGVRSTEDAWKQFFTPEDVIGIKFDPVAAVELRTSSAMARALFESLTEAGFAGDRIMFLEAPPFTAALGTRPVPPGYQEQSVTIGKERRTQFLRAMSDVTAILNVPFIKDHRLMGLSCGMVSLSLGLISNPGRFFDPGGDPAVAELAATEQIRGKHRLTIVNAIRGIYDGGPRATEAKMWDQCSILAGTDMVAVDRIALDILDSARYSRGLKSVAEVGRPAAYLATAARMGLGEAEFTQIELRRANI